MEAPELTFILVIRFLQVLQRLEPANLFTKDATSRRTTLDPVGKTEGELKLPFLDFLPAQDLRLQNR